MARTFRNLWPQLVSWDNLLNAYRKCRRRKRYKTVATEFDFAWEENLFRLQRDLIDGTYCHGRMAQSYALSCFTRMSYLRLRVGL